VIFAARSDFEDDDECEYEMCGSDGGSIAEVSYCDAAHDRWVTNC